MGVKLLRNTEFGYPNFMFQQEFNLMNIYRFTEWRKSWTKGRLKHIGGYTREAVRQDVRSFSKPNMMTFLGLGLMDLSDLLS